MTDADAGLTAMSRTGAEVDESKAFFRSIAYLVARYVAGSAYDVSMSDEHGAVPGQPTGIVTASRVDVYDPRRSCHLSGPGRDGSFTLFDFGDRSRVNLKIRSDGRFDGVRHYDVRFAGRIDHGFIELHDSSSSTCITFRVGLTPNRPEASSAAPTSSTLPRRRPVIV